MKTVMCAGTFDIVHPGHLYYLSEAKKYGDKLVVVVARDETSKEFKGKKPSHNEKERLEAVRMLKIVDSDVLGNQGNIFDIVEEIKPDIICLGYDQKVQKQELEEELKKRGVKIRIAAPITKDAANALKDIQGIAEVRHTDNKARFCIVDGKEIIFMVLDDQEVHPTYDVGIWVNTPFFAGALENLFELAWKNMKPASEVAKR